MTKHKDGRMSRVGILASVALVAVLAGCEVTNPGPVQDEFIAEPASQQGLVNGAVRVVSLQVADLSYTMALLGREIFPAGQTGAWGHGVTTQGGHITPGSGPGFTSLHEARFIGETAIKRFTERDASDAMMFQAHLWTGVAYRLLGEWFCDAVLPSTDPDVREPGAYEQGTDSYFQRAVDNFTAALEYASTAEERHAARASRAQAYMWLGDWSAAAADAASVPTDFEILALTSTEESGQYNDLYEANSGTFRSYTTRFTWFYDYYDQTGDPRVPWGVDPNFSVGVGSLSGFPGGQVPYNPQRKYTARDAPLQIVDGAEMRLIEAEALLQAGNVAGAMALINDLRTSYVSTETGQPLEPWVANSLEEAWTFLKRERAIELWLEGRRAPDERRWAANNTPGSTDVPNWEDPSHPGHTPLFTQNPRSFCFDIPNSERDLNPNVPALGG